MSSAPSGRSALLCAVLEILPITEHAVREINIRVYSRDALLLASPMCNMVGLQPTISLAAMRHHCDGHLRALGPRRAAHEYLEQEHVRGKVVLRIA